MTRKLVSYALLFVGVTLGLVAVPAFMETLSFPHSEDDIVTTTGQVTASYTKKHRRGPDTQVVEYDYVVDGVTYHGDNHLTRTTDRPNEVERLIEHHGDETTIPVYVVQYEPSLSAIHPDVGYALPIAVIGVTGICLIGGIDGLLNIADEKRERREQSRRRG